MGWYIYEVLVLVLVFLKEETHTYSRIQPCNQGQVCYKVKAQYDQRISAFLIFYGYEVLLNFIIASA